MGLEDDGCARNHRAAVFVTALVATACCFSLVPGDTLVGSLAQGTVLAVVTLAAVGASRPRALCAPGPCDGRGLLAWVLYVLAAGLAAGIVSLIVQPQGAALDISALRVMQAAALCLLTAVFEEGVFRVLALDAFVSALGEERNGMLRAALVSAALFGALHVSLGEAALAVDAADCVAVAQAVCKPMQAGLFGLFMAAMYFETRNLWTLVAVHAAFNFLYAGSQLLAGNLQQTYVTGNPVDLALLAVSTAILLPAAHAAFRSFRTNSKNV